MAEQSGTTSRRIQELADLLVPVVRFFDRSARARERAGEAACDFRAGDPQELAPSWLVQALQQAAIPRDAGWYAYTTELPAAQEAVAASLRERFGIAFRPEDVALTNAAVAAIAICLQAIIDPGDEVIITTPPHFLYEPLIRMPGGVAVRVPADPETFELDLDATAAAITGRTRAVLVNSPHNPTGRIYRPETLRNLAALLTGASERNGRPIYLLSDEAYQRVLFGEVAFETPTAFYPRSFLIYTYGKTLLAPGQRLGYIAMPPTMPNRADLRRALSAAQLVLGWAYPTALLQHALPELERHTIDLQALRRKRDRMVEALRAFGYELHVPEATFYLLVRSPDPDDQAFVDAMAEDGVLLMPGGLLEAPGFFRISLTATDDMIERSLPVFERAIKERSGG
ncbi:MAG TPA: aminotransferase class I/II-fold pyridoxal phosphate-dependent enzyme [Actinomycetota bacterium]|nr:aminotransferase class I/II-fold pyridoxal phosphate-dependent enzyme [Actinomycetota bacterium]